MLHALQHKMRVTARRTALGLAGAFALCVGLGFLTAAAWIMLAAATSALTATFVLGAVYAGLGLISLAFATARSRAAYVPHSRARRQSVDPANPMASVAVAFLQGVGAGVTARQQFAQGQARAAPHAD